MSESNPPTSDAFDDLAADEKGLVNELCQRYETALRAGRRPDPAADLASLPGKLRRIAELEIQALERDWPSPAEDSTSTPDRIGKYRVVRLLGSGSFGKVFQGRHIETGQLVAIKTPALIDPSADDLASFRREAELLSSLSHAAVVRTLFFDSDSAVGCYLVLEFIAGRTLKSLLAETRPTLSDVLKWLADVADGLAHVHRHNVVHGDVKPANVIIDEEGQARLVDFGLSFREAAQRRASEFCAGTPAYMAPEATDGKHRNGDGRSDLWSLGVILYEYLTQRLPFDGVVREDMFRAIREREPKPPRQVDPRISAELEAICLRCLEKSPKSRFTNGTDLAAALRRVRASLTRGVGDERRLVLVLYDARHAESAQFAELLAGELSARDFACDLLRSLTSDKFERAATREMLGKLPRTHAVVALLSPGAVASDVVQESLRFTREEADDPQRAGHPWIVPVFVSFVGPLPGEFDSLLGDVLPLCCDTSADSSRAIEECLGYLRDGPRKSRRHNPVGGLPPDYPHYVRRACESSFYEALNRGDSTILVRGSRQMGKTSLLARGIQAARDNKWQPIYTTLEKISGQALQSFADFYRELAGWIAEDLGLDTSVHAYFDNRDPANLCFDRFLKRVVTELGNAHTVWFIDEVDRLFDTSFRGDVFGLMRSWHNHRNAPATAHWCNLTICLSYATEAYLFVTDLNQSPFNIGTLVSLEDFSPSDIAVLNRSYLSPLRTSDEIERFHKLLGGQPYLTNCGLFEMANQRRKLSDIESLTLRNDSLFGDHLRRILMLLDKYKEYEEAVRGVLENTAVARRSWFRRRRARYVPSVQTFYRLRAAGILAGDSPQDARLRCDVYEQYLRRNLREPS